MNQARARLTDLPEIEAAVWQELRQAAQDRGHPWRTGVLATTGDDGPNARTVVLREVDADRRSLIVYTDSRSAKVTELSADPRAMFVLWAHRLGWQLRLRCTLSIEKEGLGVTSRWAHVRHSPSAQDYLSPLPPGTAISRDAGALPLAENPRAVHREHFGVISAKVESLDWLELHPDGHRRARFDAEGACWLVP